MRIPNSLRYFLLDLRACLGNQDWPPVRDQGRLEPIALKINDMLKKASLVSTHVKYEYFEDTKEWGLSLAGNCSRNDFDKLETVLKKVEIETGYKLFLPETVNLTPAYR